eukprot:GHVU01192904.1.p1 GENE.GHVU01192904.1~~GHVU01192904.1.p1  ORF type:complete len:247 (+),score=8.60 GHVU01192904.1:106-741(+)
MCECVCALFQLYVALCRVLRIPARVVYAIPSVAAATTTNVGSAKPVCYAMPTSQLPQRTRAASPAVVTAGGGVGRGAVIVMRNERTFFYLCMCVCACLSACVHICVHIFVCACVYAYVRAFVSTSVCVCMCVCVHLCLRVCVWCVHLCLHVCVCMCVCVSVCVCGVCNWCSWQLARSRVFPPHPYAGNRDPRGSRVGGERETQRGTRGDQE